MTLIFFPDENFCFYMHEAQNELKYIKSTENIKARMRKLRDAFKVMSRLLVLI